MALRVLFFGTPAFAVPTLDALLASPDATVVAVVTQPDKPRGRGQHVSASPVKMRAESAGLPVLQPTKLGGGDFLEAARASSPIWASSRPTAGCCRNRSWRCPVSA
jgi:methionyl-tRNA formyltransferase